MISIMRAYLQSQINCHPFFAHVISANAMDFLDDFGGNGNVSLVQYLTHLKERYDFRCCSLNLLCISCSDEDIPLCFLHHEFSGWCLSLSCSNPTCRRVWYCCFKCQDSPKMHRRGDLEIHNIIHSIENENEDRRFAAASEHAVSSVNDPVQQAYREELRLRQYFSHNLCWADFFVNHRRGLALKSLVAKQFSDVAEPKDISQEDAELHVLIAAHCHSLTKGERYQFAEILRRISEKYKRAYLSESKEGNHENNNTSIECSIPESRNELLHYIRGKNSIMNNVPQPAVYSATNGDAYVRLIDVLRLYLSFGLKPSTVKTINQTGPVGRYGTTEDIWQSINAKKQLQRLLHRSSSTMKAGIVKWSDGCDANTSSKGNRGSVHVCTVTLIANDNNNSEYTFLIHVGREDTNHHEVNRILMEDLQSLAVPTVFYDGQDYNQYQMVHLASIHDRPEKSKETGYGYHSGTLTLRYPFSCPVTPQLASCDECFSRRLRLKTSYKSNNNCRECYDWDFLQITYPAPKDYPAAQANQQLQARQLTFNDMKAAAEKSHNMLVSKQWSKTNALVYMRTFGINGNVANDVAENSAKTTPETLDKIIPPSWMFEFNTERFIEAVMHLVFLGVTRTIGTMMRDLLMLFRRWPTFQRQVQPYLKQLRGYSLHHCRIWTFGSSDKPFSPWVSENHLAYARCFKMAYSALCCIREQDDEEREEATRLAMLVIHSWQAVVARLMQKPSDKENNNSAERHIKVFLSYLDKVDDIIIDKKDSSTTAKEQKKKKIQTVANLTGLLNLPNQMREFGNLRDYWEGGYRGEGILKEIKQLVTQGTYHPWFAKSALTKYYKTKTLSMILDGDFFASDDDDETELEERSNNYTMFYRYNNIQTLEGCISDGQPLSGVVLSDDTVCAAVGRNRKMDFYALTIDDDNGKFIDSTYYAAVKLGNMVETDTNEHNIVHEYLVILPHLNEEDGVITYDDGSCDHYYHIVDSNWKERKCVERRITYELPIVTSMQY